MKKLFFLFILLAVFANQSHAQNLVSNGSFEQYDSCCDGLSQIYYAKYWSSFGNSPDYFNACTSSSLVSVPDNFLGYHYASTGFGYIGILLYTTNTINQQEYIGTTLNQPLLSGETYNISAKISPAFTDSIGVNLACNNFGFQFTNHQFSMSQSISTNNYSHLNFTNIVTDTAGWTLMSGSFTADSNYHYISIGNFYDHANTDTLHMGQGMPSGYWGAYYFLDDISVSSNLGMINLDRGFCISPNPTNDFLRITIDNPDIYYYKVYDVYGHFFLGDRLESQSSYFVYTSQLPDGIYFLNLLSKNNNSTINFIVKH